MPAFAGGQHIATFSIVARDPATGELGVGVQSKYFGVGSVVPHARARIGALATQARGNILYGAQGLGLLESGLPPEDVLERLLAEDPLREERQVGIVSAQGGAATFTDSETLPWSGGKTGDHYAAQGNLLAGPEVVDAMAAAFETTEGDLATRLVTAFITGQSPLRTGLTKVGMPGAKEGMTELDPTIAGLLKNHGYMTAQFGKNHLGDLDEHLPTNHGFDEFFGNLYHINAEEEPENVDYPKDPEFKKKSGPRGVIKSTTDGMVEHDGHIGQILDKLDMFVPAQAFVSNWLATLKEFPPRQKPGSFSLSQVMDKLTQGAGGGGK